MQNAYHMGISSHYNQRKLHDLYPNHITFHIQFCSDIYFIWCLYDLYFRTIAILVYNKTLNNL